MEYFRNKFALSRLTILWALELTIAPPIDRMSLARSIPRDHRKDSSTRSSDASEIIDKLVDEGCKWSRKEYRGKIFSRSIRFLSDPEN